VEKAQPLLRGQPIMAGDRKLSQGLKSFSAIESVPPLVLPGWRLVSSTHMPTIIHHNMLIIMQL
jgi:hypothetical protein